MSTGNQGGAAELRKVPLVKSKGLPSRVSQSPCRLKYLTENRGNFPEIRLRQVLDTRFSPFLLHCMVLYLVSLFESAKEWGAEQLR